MIATRGHDRERRAVGRDLHATGAERTIEGHVGSRTRLSPEQSRVESFGAGRDSDSALEIEARARLELRTPRIPSLARGGRLDARSRASSEQSDRA
jgi:hypothetical protein